MILQETQDDKKGKSLWLPNTSIYDKKPADFKLVWVTDGQVIVKALYWQQAKRWYIPNLMITSDKVIGWSEDAEPPHIGLFKDNGSIS